MPARDVEVKAWGWSKIADIVIIVREIEAEDSAKVTGTTTQRRRAIRVVGIAKTLLSYAKILLRLVPH